LLDPVLYSLLNLKEKSTLYELDDGRYQLVNVPKVELEIKKQSRELARSYKSLKKSPRFNLVTFCKKNGIKQDLIGTHSLVFSNPRIVWHVLQLSYAITLTFQMHGFAKLKVSQRKSAKAWQLSSQNLFTNVFRFILSQVLRKEFTDEKEKDLIKLLKVSLSRGTSLAWEQDELPEGDFIELIPKNYWDQILKHSTDDEVARFCFSILQSKALCEEVPESFVQDSLEKHRKQLSSPLPPLRPEIIEVLRQQGREFGRTMKQHGYYNPNKGFMPTNKATYSFQRLKGGVKGDLVFNDVLRNDKHVRFDPKDRPEPFVILLTGQPGSGKSTKLNQIVAGLSELFPGTTSENLTYQRTCCVEHWDGYTGQPITIMDDLGQSSKGDDIREFQTLVSTCPYVLPMAELEDKGMYFSSPIIICTTNLSFGESLAHRYKELVIIDDNSFWRRFHFPILSENGNYYRCHVEDYDFKLKSKNQIFPPEENKLPPLKGISNTRSTNDNVNNTRSALQKMWTEIDLDKWDFKPEIKRRWNIHQNISHRWQQTIMTGINDTVDDFYDWLYSQDLPESLSDLIPEKKTEVNAYLSFPAYPPSHPLPVRVEPIREPLKVRTITAGMGETFCLKPFQHAMWKTLQHYPQFTLTHGTNRLEKGIERIFESSKDGEVWISGDYTAATDSVPLEASKALMEGILESIDHLPTKRWALKELSPHLLVYPKASGLAPVMQESGQLMGSLLSFPLLCLLNDCTAKMAGLSRSKYLINGDDILMRGQPEIYPKWKSIVSEVGLQLSIGKNYIHPRYGSINSQMVIDGMMVESGKQRILDRKTRVLGECVKDFQLAMTEHSVEESNELFLSVNRQKLARTVRNLGIPYSHGGLGFSWDETHLKKTRNPYTAKAVYIHDLLKRIKPNSNSISVPYFAKRDLTRTELRIQAAQCLEPVELKESHEEHLHIGSLKGVSPRIEGHPVLREIIANKDIRHLPPLPFIHTFQIPIRENKDIGVIQNKIDTTFFQSLLEGCPYTYHDFREHVLKGLCDIKDSTREELKVGFTLHDFPAELDFLTLDLNYTVKPFSKDDFVKKLGQTLCPKDNGVTLEGMLGIDFSHQLDEDERRATELFSIELMSEKPNYDIEEFDLLDVFRERRTRGLVPPSGSDPLSI
jgi:hypothetical protein